MTTGRKVGSGGQRARGLAGRGPTPKAEDRVYHKAYKGLFITMNLVMFLV